MFIRKLTILFLFFLSSYTCYAQSIVTDFSGQLIIDNDTRYLQITALKDNGITDYLLDGKHTFVINNKDTVILNFFSGKARFKVTPGTSTYFIKYIPGEEFALSKTDLSKLYYFNIKDTAVKRFKVPLWLSILPPLLAIFLALVVREVYLSLFAGIWIGSFILLGFQPANFIKSLFDVVQIYIINVLANPDHLAVIIFSMLIGGMVAIVSRNGGMAGIVKRLARFANSARNTQLVTWFMGIAIFFDDYANTLIVGNTLRPVTDRFRISREKLAYIVDSTAAPISAIALVTTWIGAELGYIGNETVKLGIAESPYSIFINSLQFAFYPILTIIFVFMLIYTRRDFGSMRKAEQRARISRQITEASNTQSDNSLSKLDAIHGIKYRWQNALIPILVMIGVTIAGLMVTGYDETVWKSDASLFSKLSSTIGAASSFMALVWGSLSGVIIAVIMSVGYKTMSLRYSIETMIDGFKTMLPAIMILILAWGLADITEKLYTADFLTQSVRGVIVPELMPILAFILAATISFATGSSWSTMAILYPLILPMIWILCQEAGLSYGTSMSYFYHVTATVLAGSVFGDHCSPISDTTVLSSLASGCNHIDHVRTQIPYAITVGMVSLACAFLFSYLGLPWWLIYPIAILALFFIIRLLGRRIQAPVVSQNG